MKEKKPILLICLLALLAVGGCTAALQAQDPTMRARAALALAAAQKTDCGLKPATSCCGCTSPADCNCGPTCSCLGCTAHAHAKTCKADDGGPDWTWDADRKDWWRKVSVKRDDCQPGDYWCNPHWPWPNQAMAPQFYAPPPMFFAPRPTMSFGGGRRGGC